MGRGVSYKKIGRVGNARDCSTGCGPWHTRRQAVSLWLCSPRNTGDGLQYHFAKAQCAPPKLKRAVTMWCDNIPIDRLSDSSFWYMLFRPLVVRTHHACVRTQVQCIPYEFNMSDLSACALFLEKHLYAQAISWETLQYIVGEVQYGGKITDDFDRRLFSTFAATPLPSLMSPKRICSVPMYS